MKMLFMLVFLASLVFFGCDLDSGSGSDDSDNNIVIPEADAGTSSTVKEINDYVCIAVIDAGDAAISMNSDSGTHTYSSELVAGHSGVTYSGTVTINSFDYVEDLTVQFSDYAAGGYTINGTITYHRNMVNSPMSVYNTVESSTLAVKNSESYNVEYHVIMNSSDAVDYSVTGYALISGYKVSFNHTITP